MAPRDLADQVDTMTKENPASFYMEAAARSLGDRQTLLIVWSALHGISSFHSYRRVCRTTDATLRRRLQRLEESGLIARQPEDAPCAGASWRLTAKGEALRPAMEALRSWSADWA